MEASSSCLQTTVASFTSHISSHTVPQLLFRQISTRPSLLVVPPANRRALLAHPANKSWRVLHRWIQNIIGRRAVIQQGRPCMNLKCSKGLHIAKLFCQKGVYKHISVLAERKQVGLGWEELPNEMIWYSAAYECTLKLSTSAYNSWDTMGLEAWWLTRNRQLPATHTTPASWLCAQFSTSIPLCVQSNSLLSRPLHITSSKKMGPVPCPKTALSLGTAPVQ